MTLPPWLLLLLAITTEILGTSFLKTTEGFTKPFTTLLVLGAYATSMLLLSRVVQTIPLGITYALWSGIGIVAIVIVGMLAYRQVPTQAQLIGMGFITVGVITVNLGGQIKPG